jgi:phosphoglycerate dehydrogenase-like enzyme
MAVRRGVVYTGFMSKRLTIWTDVRVEGHAGEMLATGIGGHEVVRGDEGLLRAEVAFGQPPVEGMLASKMLRWVHISSAGYTTYDRAEVWAGLKQRGVAFTNSSSVFDEACAEHVLAMMLGLNRLLPRCVERQRSARAWPEKGMRGGMRLLRGQSVIMYGYGAIGKSSARMLAPFEMEIVGVRRRGSHRQILTDADGRGGADKMATKDTKDTKSFWVVDGKRVAGI